MLAKVLVPHHSFFTKSDLQTGDTADLPKKMVETNPTLYAPFTEEEPKKTPADRAKLESKVVKLKLARKEEVARLSLEQLTELCDAGLIETKEGLVAKAVELDLGKVDELEAFSVEELTTLVYGK